MPRIRHHLQILWCALATLLLVVGCASDSSNSRPDTTDAYDSTEDIAEDSSNTDVTIPCEPEEAGVDSDNDGLPNIVEDTNRNCRVDPGESDPWNPDSDGDGILDGVEDVDRNGVWNPERGETDPQAVDSDHDGVEDIDELKSIACRARQVDNVLSQRAGLSDGSTLFVPTGFQQIDEVTSDVVAVRSTSSSGGRYAFFFRDAPSFTVFQNLADEVFQADMSQLHLTWLGERRITPNQWISRYHVELQNSVSPQYLLQLAVQWLRPELSDSPKLDEIWQDSDMDIRSGEVQVAWLSREGKHVAALALSTESADENWFRSVHPRALSPSVDSRLRIQCSEVQKTTATDANIHVVMPERILMYGRVDRALDEISSMLDSGQLSDVQIHIAGSSMEDTPVASMNVETSMALEELVATHRVDTLEGVPRAALWTSLASVVENEPEAVALLLADRESKEFFQTTEASPGPSAIPNGDKRRALKDGLIRGFRESSIELTVAGPDARYDTPGCGEQGTPPALRLEESSYRSIVRGLGGGLANICAETSKSLFYSQVAEVVQASPFVGVSHDPVWGSGVLVNREGFSTSARFNRKFGEIVLTPKEAISGPDAGLSFTFWEKAVSVSN